MRVLTAMNSAPLSHSLPAAVLMPLLLISCGDRTASNGGDSGKAKPSGSSGAGEQSLTRKNEPFTGSRGGGPAVPGAGQAGNSPLIRSGAVLMPEGKGTGGLPAAWEGRTAQEEEARLRQSGGWEAGYALFFEQWGKADPVAAIAASRNTDRGGITFATAAAAAGWAAVDLKAAMAWVQGQPANAEHAAFTAAVLRVANPGGPGGQDYELMAEWLGNQVRIPSLQPTVDRFVRSWSQSSREAAVDWTMARITDESARSSILSGVVQDSVNTGPDGFAKTGNWLLALPPGLERDELLVAFVREAAQHDPAASAKWAAQIGNGILRQRAEKMTKARF